MQNFLINVCPVLFLLFNYVNSQACCPEGAWGELKNPDYQDLGQVEKIEEDISALEPELIKPSMDIYKIGKYVVSKYIYVNKRISDIFLFSYFQNHFLDLF